MPDEINDVISDKGQALKKEKLAHEVNKDLLAV